jgi:hypothetical protein
MSIKVDIRGAVRKTKALKNIPRATGHQLGKWGAQAHIQISRNISGGIVGKYKWGNASGKLHRSIKSHIKILGNRYVFEIGSYNVKYARILEKGGTIYPKRKKYLAVPMPDGSIRLCKKVKIPKFEWLGKSIKEKRSLLDRMMSKQEILRVAMRL